MEVGQKVYNFLLGLEKGSKPFAQNQLCHLPNSESIRLVCFNPPGLEHDRGSFLRKLLVSTSLPDICHMASWFSGSLFSYVLWWYIRCGITIVTVGSTMAVPSRLVLPRPHRSGPSVLWTEPDPSDSKGDWHTPWFETSPAGMHLCIGIWPPAVKGWALSCQMGGKYVYFYGTEYVGYCAEYLWILLPVYHSLRLRIGCCILNTR